VQRAKGSARLPARFQLVLAANPCPCGNAGSPARELSCTCTSLARRGYLSRLSGPLLDRVDVQVDVPAVSVGRWAAAEVGEATAVVAVRVRRAREAAAARWAGVARTNALVPGPLLRSPRFRPSRRVLAPLLAGVERGTLTARGFDRLLRVAWTVADLSGRDRPGGTEVAEAMSLRSLAVAA
jgi:magnesium chelatase family protein